MGIANSLYVSEAWIPNFADKHFWCVAYFFIYQTFKTHKSIVFSNPYVHGVHDISTKIGQMDWILNLHMSWEPFY